MQPPVDRSGYFRDAMSDTYQSGELVFGSVHPRCKTLEACAGLGARAHQ